MGSNRQDSQWPGRIIAIGDVRIHTEKLRDRCVMTAFDPELRHKIRPCCVLCVSWMAALRSIVQSLLQAKFA
jgi:hypothetical protein